MPTPVRCLNENRTPFRPRALQGLNRRKKGVIAFPDCHARDGWTARLLSSLGALPSHSGVGAVRGEFRRGSVGVISASSAPRHIQQVTAGILLEYFNGVNKTAKDQNETNRTKLYAGPAAISTSEQNRMGMTCAIRGRPPSSQP